MRETCLLCLIAVPGQVGPQGAEEEDEEDLSVLMQRLRSANPPEDVLKVMPAGVWHVVFGASCKAHYA